MKLIFCILTILIVSQCYPLESPAARHGKLRVQGVQLVSSSGQPVQLRGLSTHGPQWFPQCYTYESFRAMVEVWKASVIRIAMYVNEQGYNTNPSYWRGKVQEMVDWSGQLGVYVLIDWHVLTPGNPNDGSYNGAEEFWRFIANNNKGKDHVLYEIANEPNGVDWNTIQQYHTRIINLIRSIDPDTVIVLGTPSWSSDFNSIYPLNFPNLMYTLHFYAASHYVNDDHRRASQKYPIFVTEYGTCTYTGDGQVNINNANNWVDFMNGNNWGSQKISFINWSFSDAKESCAALQVNACNSKNWISVKESGEWVRKQLANQS